MPTISSATKSNTLRACFQFFNSCYDTANTPAFVAKIIIEQDTAVAAE